MSRVVVLGATGGVGRALTGELAARGHDVTAVSRRGDADVPAGVRRLAADLQARDQALEAGSRADVIAMAAQVPYRRWPTDLGPMIDNVVAAAAAADARLVMVDNLYAYGAPHGPISEATPEATTTRKGALRRELGRRLLAAHHDGRLRVAIGRFSDYYGPGGTNSVVYALGMGPALRGKPARALGDPDQPHTFHYLPDVARGFATLVERTEADGHVWILPAAPAITQREFARMLFAELGRPAKLRRVTPAMLALVGVVNADVRELRELLEQWDRPYTVDASAFAAALGPVETTPHDRAVAETVRWFRDR